MSFDKRALNFPTDRFMLSTSCEPSIRPVFAEFLHDSVIAERSPHKYSKWPKIQAYAFLTRTLRFPVGNIPIYWRFIVLVCWTGVNRFFRGNYLTVEDKLLSASCRIFIESVFLVGKPSPIHPQTCFVQTTPLNILPQFSHH